jgi:hypothetical protein
MASAAAITFRLRYSLRGPILIEFQLGLNFTAWPGMILSAGGTVRIVARPRSLLETMNAESASSARMPRDNARGVESLLWLAAGAAWAIVALKAWSQTKKFESRKRTWSVSDRLLKQVFPNGIRS